MKALIGNGAHGSNVFITLEMDSKGKPKTISKSSSMEEGIANIRKELEGFQWYNKRSRKKVRFHVNRDENSYILAKFDFIDGQMYPLRRGVRGNIDPIFATLKHYVDIWREYSSVGEGPLHGDFCLGNAIFVKSEPVMVDWEHFSPDGVPIGFDALFLIYLSLWFESENQLPKGPTLLLIAKMISFLIQNKCLNQCFVSAPLESMRNFIKENRILWGTQSGKIPMMLFKENVVNFVDKKVCLMIS